MLNKQIIGIFVALALLGLGVFVFVKLRGATPEPAPPAVLVPSGAEQRVIGTSAEGREIEAYVYGKGDIHVAFVGGIHGGYEWNTVLLAYTFIDYLNEQPEAIPGNITVTVIPNANPDGVHKVIGKEGRFTMADVPANASTSLGRFNAHNVDLNRNFDCNWKPEGVWKGNVVSAGSKPFSEPEAIAIRDFVLETNPDAVVFWHSKANAVYPGECGEEILPETRDIMNAYAAAATYQALNSFDTYEVTGSADGWVSLLGIPALTVELETHETIEWERNFAGITALFEYYGQE